MARKDTSKTKQKKPSTESSTWRSIAQNGRLRSTSAAARARRLGRWFRWSAVVAGVLLVGAGVGYGVYFSGSHLEVFDPKSDPVALSRYDFASDGVLDQAWMEAQFPFEDGASAMSFDVRTLQAALERVGQVSEARVSIVLPDTIKVRVHEREPLLRARVRTPGGDVRTVLVAADGAVFEGSRYPLEMLRHLPGLTGVRFQWEGDRFRPIEAMRTVAPLIEQARARFPELYRSWQWISLEDLPTDPDAPRALISVKSREADQIIFAPRVFHRQLSKLSEVVGLSRERNLSGFRRIDLSFSDQAIVQFRES